MLLGLFLGVFGARWPLLRAWLRTERIYYPARQPGDQPGCRGPGGGERYFLLCFPREHLRCSQGCGGEWGPGLCTTGLSSCPLSFHQFPRTRPPQAVCGLLGTVPVPQLLPSPDLMVGPRAVQEKELGEAGVLTSWVPGCDVVW